jgi:hypothetical protein
MAVLFLHGRWSLITGLKMLLLKEGKCFPESCLFLLWHSLQSLNPVMDFVFRALMEMQLAYIQM